jgi:hypothetical protein
MKMNDFIDAIELMASGREDEIDLASMPIYDFFSPDCLYLEPNIGPDGEPGIDVFKPIDNTEDLWSLVEDVFSDVIFSKINTRVEMYEHEMTLEALMLLDCLYGILFQSSARQGRTLGLVDFGTLSFLYPSGSHISIVDSNRFLGEGLLNAVRSLLSNKVNRGSFGLYEIYEKIDRAIPFFLLCPNVFVFEDDGEGYVSGIDPLVNFDLGYGSLLGWYRLERIVRTFDNEFRLPFSEKDRALLGGHCSNLFNEFEWVYHAVSDLLSEEGREIYGRLISLYRKVYGGINEDGV